MAREQQNREVETFDMVNDESDGALDWNMLRTGVAAVATVTEREFNETKDMEMFMQELLVIQIHTSTDRNAIPSVPLALNGDKVWVPRGVKVRIPRRLVGVLAQSQAKTFRTTPNPDPSADDGMIQRQSTGSSFPFSVLHDPNPRGPGWLRRVMREGC